MPRTKAFRYMMYSMHVPVKVYRDGTFDTFGELMTTSYELLDALPVAAKPLEKIDVTSWFPARQEEQEDDSPDDSSNDGGQTKEDDEEEVVEEQEEPLYISVAELESAIRRKPGATLNQTLRWRPVARLSASNTSRKVR